MKFRKFIIYNSSSCRGFGYNLSDAYFNLLSSNFKIKRVKQKRFNAIISLDYLVDFLDIIDMVGHDIIIEKKLNPFLGIDLPVIQIYDDWIE